MDAEKQEKLKDINRRFEFYQRLDGTGTLFAGQYVQDLGFLLQLVREQEEEIIEWQEACWSKDDQVTILKDCLAKYERVVESAKAWHEAFNEKHDDRCIPMHPTAQKLHNSIDALEADT